MATERQKLIAVASLVLVMILWAGNSIVARAVRDDVAPFTLAFVRWAGASVALAPFAIGRVREDWPVILRHWKPIALLGLLGVGAFNGLLYSGLQYTTATNALLWQSAVPALVVLLDRFMFGTRVGLGHSLGVLASVMGVATIVFQGDLAAAARLEFGIGDIFLLGSVVVWALYTVLLRLRPAISPISFIAVTFFIGVLSMAPFALWEVLSGRGPEWSPGLGGAFLYVALLPSLLSYFIYNSAADTLGPARAGQAITMMPLFGAFLSAMLLGESLHGYHYAGMGFIVAGIVISAVAAQRGGSGGGGRGTGAPPTAPLEDRA